MQPSLTRSSVGLIPRVCTFEVAVDGGPGDAGFVGDLLDGVVTGVVHRPGDLRLAWGEFRAVVRRCGRGRGRRRGRLDDVTAMLLAERAAAA